MPREASGPATCDLLVYNGEDAGLGFNYGWGDPNGTCTVTETTTNAHSGTTALLADLTWPSGTYGGTFGWELTSPADASQMGEIHFWIRTESGEQRTLQLGLTDMSGAGDTVTVVPTGNMSGVQGITATWQQVRVPLESFTKADKTQIHALQGIAIGGGAAGAVKLLLDDICFGL